MSLPSPDHTYRIDAASRRRLQPGVDSEALERLLQYFPAESRALIQETAKVVYRALGCRGLSRVDFFLKEDGTVVLNEVNTFPGLTSYSRYPRMMTAAGFSMADVIDRLVSVTLTGQAR